MTGDSDDDHQDRSLTRVLVSFPVLKTTRPAEIARGERRLELPAGAEPVVYTRERRVSWFLEVVGKIPRWPDLSFDFELPVVSSVVP